MTKDTGKVNNGAGCAVCHTTELRVGERRHYTLARGEFSEKSFFVRKGTNHPMWLSELLRNLPPTPVTTGTPSTTETYSAAVLPGTNLPAAFILQDPQNRLGTNKPWAQFPPNPDAPFGAVIVPRIEVLLTNLGGNVALDANPNEGGGLRVYPDQINPTDSALRNVVSVKIRTTPPVAGQAVRLKSFDVDDPTSWDVDDQRIIDPNDRTAGFRGLDNQGTNAGLPGAGVLAQAVLTLNAQGEATTTLTLPMAPGNNFRVVALLDTAGAPAHLDKLQVTNIQSALYVTPDQEPVEGFVGALSPMLTVWRKLHLEFDSMAAPPASGPEVNYVSATVSGFRLNYPTAGRSHVALVHGGADDGVGLFERGKLEISGLGSFAVTNSWTLAYLNGRAGTTVEILGVPSGLSNGQTARLFDDDDRYLANDLPLYPSNLGLAAPPVPALAHVTPFLQAAEPKFAPAYLTLVDANSKGWNTISTVPFKRQEPGHSIFGTVFDNGNLQLKGADRPEFWAFSVVFGYQSTAPDDGEPDEEIPLSGGTPETRVPTVPEQLYIAVGYSVVFLENIRDYEFGRRYPSDPMAGDFTHVIKAPSLRDKYIQRVFSVMAHEIGHPPGRNGESEDHEEDGLMITGAPQGLAKENFSPRTIVRFRSATRWLN